jgi:hypothetical protein
MTTISRGLTTNHENKEKNMFAEFGFSLKLNNIRDLIQRLITLSDTGNQKKTRMTVLICICLAASGCSSITGAPKPIIDVDMVAAQYTEDLNNWAKHPPTACGDIRAAANEVLTLMDLRYAKFVDDISVESKTKATLTDITLTGLGLAGTAVGGAEAKTIFNALSAGTAAANTSIDKNFFYEKTLPALVSKMNADRKAQHLLIIQRLQGCSKPGDYLWFEAVHDLTDYYAAGTLLGAIASISKDAGASQVKSEVEIKKAVVPFTPSKDTDDKTWLRQRLRQAGGSSEIMACWRQVNPDLFRKDGNADLPCAGGTPSPARLINASECAADQAKVRNCIENP